MNSTATIEKQSVHWNEYLSRWTFDGTPEEAVIFTGGLPGFESRMQFEFLMEQGLKPHHKFMDLPCGCLRGTIRAVDYLDHGNFFGLDISVGLLKNGLLECQRQKYTKIPMLLLADGFDYGSMGLPKFDYILSVSLLAHLYPDDIPLFFEGIRSILAPQGRAFITLYPLSETEPEPFRGDVQLAWYKKSWLIQEAKACGLKMRDLPGELRQNRLPQKQKPLLPMVNSYLSQWVMEATLA